MEVGLGPCPVSAVLVYRRHLRTVLGLRPRCGPSVYTLSAFCWIRCQVAGIVVVQPYGIFYISLPGTYDAKLLPHPTNLCP